MRWTASCNVGGAPVRITRAAGSGSATACPRHVSCCTSGEAMRIDDDLPLMLWTARPDLSCDYVSRAWLDFTGYSPEQALGHGWSRALHPEDLARWLDTCVRAFDARQPFALEYRLRRRDGQYRWVLDRATPRGGSAFAGFSGVCVDI